MLDIKYIRENIPKLKQAATDKRIKVDFDRLVEIDQVLKDRTQKLEALQAERNSQSKLVAKATAQDRQTIIEQVNKLKTDMEALSQEIEPLRSEFDDLMLLVPQPARADVPVGKDDSDNVELRKVGSLPSFGFKVKDHVELGKKLNIIDIERGVKLAGSRSYVLRGDGARLEQAIMRYSYDKLLAKGYEPLSIPVLVTEDAMKGTGYFPTGRDQAYFIEKDSLALVGTGEVSLTSFHRNEILKEAELPLKFITQSSCFRREAGTYGKDTHGLYRVHQFQKIEQVIVAEASEASSEKYHDELLTNAEELLQDFGLAYRVVYVCTGDLGQGQVRKHDIETWMPSREAYCETHSCSTFHDFQARRLKMRYKDGNGKKHLCYTLNNTAVATPRVLIPILENFQNEDGTINIPECLQSYMGGQTKIQ